MAQALTFRQVAGIHGDEAGIFDGLAKAKRNEARALKQTFDSNTTEAVKLQCIALYEKAIHYYQMAESHTQQETDYNAMADAAGEPA
jgi:pantothenate kinase type III